MSRSIITFILFFFVTTIGFAATSPADFTADTDALLKRYVKAGRVDYAGLKASNDLAPLIEKIAQTDYNSFSGNERKAYLINAYNLLVIHQALENYPLKSVLDVSGFFDRNKFTVGGKQTTLNGLEKGIILKQFKDARLHFVLVCGATGCPPITTFAYDAKKLESQLNQQTKAALNDPTFIQVSGSDVGLSQIFEWYQSDFGGSKNAVRAFINKHRSTALPADANLRYYPYDWSLNQAGGRSSLDAAAPDAGGGFGAVGANNEARYVVSSTIPKGTFEVKIFNNLYSQEVAGERSSFFTSLTSVLYGATDRVNVGFDLRYRRVRYDQEGTASNFDVFSEGGTFNRNVVATIGPKVRIAPFDNLPNFSVQSAFWIPVADDLTGAENNQRFVDFDGATWFTQIFNDFPVGDNFSIFGEVDINLEDIGASEDGHINRFSTPVTGIVSYFPTPQATVYGLASYAPYWQENFDYFYQLGAGAKYQFTPNLELEILATAFQNGFIADNNGNAGTVNLGLRFNL